MRPYPYKVNRVEKLVIRYVHTKWMIPSKRCGIFSVHCFDQVHYNITTSEEIVVVFSIIITIILSYSIIRVYTTLLI